MLKAGTLSKKDGIRTNSLPQNILNTRNDVGKYGFPEISQVISKVPTRNRSYSNNSLNEEKALIQLANSPGNVSRNTNNILTSTPGKKSNVSVLSTPAETIALRNDSNPRLRPTKRR